mmetsp:Transcript_29647/g.52058  ORF Transcript_29647/g.52058 Transcript_29647/m.52058 type:complete len:114 (+) Transcript_29647:65-406(+)
MAKDDFKSECVVGALDSRLCVCVRVCVCACMCACACVSVWSVIIAAANKIRQHPKPTNRKPRQPANRCRRICASISGSRPLLLQSPPLSTLIPSNLEEAAANRYDLATKFENP